MRHSRITTLAVLLPALMVLPVDAAAQRWQLDLGGTRVKFDEAAALSSASIAPFIEWTGGIAYFSLGGSLAAFEGAQWATQGRADLSLLSPRLGSSPVRFELLGSSAGTYHSTEFRTAATRGEARLHMSSRRAGVWFGGVGATGWTSAAPGIARGGGPTVGLWGRDRDWTATAVFTPLQIEGFWYPELTGRASVSVGPVDLLGYGGWREGAAASNVPDATAWGGAVASIWLGRQAALVLSGGSYPSDLLQGLPDGRYLSAALRFSNRRPSVWTFKSPGRPVYAREGESGALRFKVAGASQVQVVGDWNGWEPVPMVRGSDGRWVLPVALQPGVYRFNLIVNGEQWIVPEGVVAVDDGFGGVTGLLIIPE